jgi:hypothetical protein
MATDQLLSRVAEIEAFCKQNGICLFYGHTTHEIGTYIEWDDEEPVDGLEQVLLTAKRAGIAIVHLERESNYLIIDEKRLQESLSYQDDEEERASILKDVEEVRRREGQLLRLTLSFFYQGGCYTASKKADWAPVYEGIDELLYGNADDEDDDLFDDDNNEAEGEYIEDTDEDNSVGKRTTIAGDHVNFLAGFPMVGKTAELDKETIEQKARTILQSEKYLRCKTKYDRRTAAKQLLQADGLELLRDRWAIEEKAEELYQDEVVPRQEKEYVDKIKSYLQNTDNPSMAGAARVLGMDYRRVGPYWEKAKGL